MKTSMIVTAALAAFALQACSEPAPTTPPAAAAPAAAPAGATPAVMLDGEVLQLGGSSPTIMAIGAPKAEALAAVTAAVGAGPAEAAAYEGCGAGAIDYASYANGLILLFQDGALAGWQSTKADLSSRTGIHVGSTKAELDAAYPGLTYEDNTIGSAFMAGGMGGYLDEAKAKVERLNVGVTCDMT